MSEAEDQARWDARIAERKSIVAWLRGLSQGHPEASTLGRELRGFCSDLAHYIQDAEHTKDERWEVDRRIRPDEQWVRTRELKP